MLAAIATAQQAREVIDTAAALADLARRARLGVAIVNHATTVRVRAELRLAALVGEGQAAGIIGTGGRPETVRTADRFADLGIDKRRLAESRRLAAGYTEDDILELAASRTACGEELTRASLLKTNTQLIHSSDSPEWFTPAEYLEAARRVLGGIDLDPASCALANQTVQAARYYTREDDGLAQPWKGRVWLNPPYCGQAGPFVARLCDSYQAGHVTAAIVLVSALAFGATWWRPLLGRVLCFTYGRIKFTNPGGAPPQAPFCSAFAYFGPDEAAFAAEFARFGAVLAPWRGVAS